MPENLRFEIVNIKDIAEHCQTPDLARSSPVVLIVDDERLIADTLAIILMGKGYAAIAAYDAESALELAEIIPPDLLISDVGLPRQSGIELAILVQQMVSDCKVLLFSGQASSIDLLASARDAGHRFTLLTKPIHPSDLLMRISELDVPLPIATKADVRPWAGRGTLLEA
jgi:DNA-binding response OmpR family regulator